MSYSTLPAPSDLFGVNSGIRSRVFPLNNDRRSEESHSPTSEPRSPLFRPALPAAELPPHLVSLYNSPYAAAAVAAAMAGQGSGAPASSVAHLGHFGRVPSSFYPTMVGGEAWRRPPYLSQLDMYWPGLRSLEAVVGPRTKAPREATSILKSWLNEHKDNPYPTKSEKMTLSIVTHMTLTQVSTWFANARRRIKKENKMTWTPKTRSGERDDNSSNEEESDRDYFGRHQRSPFSTSRNSADGSFSSFDESKRAGFTEGRSTLPCGQSSLRPAHSYPIFSGLNGLNSDCRRQAEDNTTRPDEIKFPVKRAMHSNDSTPNDKSANNNGKPYRNTPFAVKERSISDDQVSADEEKGISRPPFIQLGKRRSYSIEQNASTADSRGEDSHSPKRPHYTRPIPPARNDATEHHATPNVYGHSMHHRNVDVISSWMKDFQRLVTTGQEDKARQALAAFALAAKAGAYPEIGKNASISQIRGTQQNNSSERNSPLEHSPGNPNRQARNSILFSPNIQGDRRHDDNHRRSDSSDDERKQSLSNSAFVNFAARKSSTSNHCNQKSTNDRSESLKPGRTILDADWKSKENGNIRQNEDSAK